jgi:hypothetical protein
MTMAITMLTIPMTMKMAMMMTTIAF